MESIIEYMNTHISFLDSGIYEMADSLFERAAAWILVFYLKLKLAGITMSFNVATFFLDSINMTHLVQNSINSLPSQVVSVLTFFKIPVAINTIISAYTTRFIMDIF